MEITEKAYAKLNLSLDVLGKRPDGYHDLRMIMESVELADDVELTLREDGEIRMSANLSWLPVDRRNLAVEAVRVFREALGRETLGADIRLVKRIPVGAGMAGGSTDAAAVLRGLNRLLGRPFDADGLRELGLKVGSDVPYCVTGGSCLAEGRGERLTPLPPVPECWVVVAKPGFSISTGELFGRVDGRCVRTKPDTQGLIEALERQELTAAAVRMYNVFEDVLPRHCGEIGAIRGDLLSAGAVGAVMTGTGSAVFGVFPQREEAAAAAAALRDRCKNVFLTRFIPALEI